MRPLWLALAAALVATPAHALDEAQLAQRFSPYLKFAKGEKFHPCTWQHLWSVSNLTRGGRVVVTAAELAADPRRSIAWSDLRVRGSGRDVRTELIDDGASREGLPWARVREGAGIYAHVTRIDEALYNLEYYVLFAYNDPPHSGDLYNHQVDLGGIQLVYDARTDALLRATYSIHGQARVAFDLTRTVRNPPSTLPNHGLDSPQTTVAVQKARALPHAYHDNDVTGGPHELYFAAATAAGPFEHPVVYFEGGSHEPWPTSSGKYRSLLLPHEGKGVGFLVERVTILDPAADEPFYFFAGRMGREGDVNALQFHRMWFRPHPFVPDDQRSDKSPYETMTALKWPPVSPGVAGCAWIDFSAPGGACPPNTAARGLACRGGYCGAVALSCCPAAPTGPPRELATFSEEGAAGQTCPDGHFLSALRCSGRYCDNLTARCAPLSRGQVGVDVHSISEEDPPTFCAPGSFVHGLRCKGRYCDRIDFDCFRPGP